MNKSRVNRIIGVLAFALITAMASLLFVGYSPTVVGTTKHLPVDSANPFTPEVALPKVIATIPLGVNASPEPIAVNPVTGYVYVGNWGNNTVAVISGTHLVTTLAVGSAPTAIAVNPTTGYVYVTNAASGTVSVISGLQVIATLPVGQNPRNVKANPATGYVYVMNWSDDTVTIIKGTQVITTVLVAHNPNAIGVNPSTGYVYIGGINSNQITVLSATQVITTIQVPWGPAAINVDPTSGYIYSVLSSSAAGIGILSGTEYIMSLVPGISTIGSQPAVDVNMATHMAYALTSDGVLQIVSGTELIDSVPIGFSSYDVKVSSVSNFAYVTNWSSKSLNVISGTQKIGAVTTGSGADRIGVNPNTGLVYVTNFVSNTVSVIKEGITPSSPTPLALSSPDEDLIIDFEEAVLTPTVSIEITPAFPITTTWSFGEKQVVLSHASFVTSTVYQVHVLPGGESGSGSGS
jgi:YVTN family beta-propeller protein